MGKLLCDKIDFDLEIVRDVYEDAKETIGYLSDIVKSIEKRVLTGEKIDGFALVPGRKSRIITENGVKYLEATLGEDAFKTTRKPIGITDLENLVSQEELIDLHNKGVIAFKEGSPKVVTTKK